MTPQLRRIPRDITTGEVIVFVVSLFLLGAMCGALLMAFMLA